LRRRSRLESCSHIEVSEIFISIQGEGLDVGKPAAFLRTSGCSLRCAFCDTEYAWGKGVKRTVEDVKESLLGFRVPYIVITGGEPLEQECIASLLRGLSESNAVESIDVESSGTVFREDIFHPKVKLTLSPKPPSMGVEFPEGNVLRYLSLSKPVFLKFPILTAEDFDFLKDFLYRNKEVFRDEFVVQPIEVCGTDYRITVKRVVEMLLSDRKFINSFRVRVIPQVHKFIGIR